MSNHIFLRNFLIVLLSFIHCGVSTCQVLWAVNCGGDRHTDVNGIEYEADFLEVGTASDYGRSFPINRVPEEDHIIYQTERYHTGDFSYAVPLPADGSYVLSLKFSEVWFTEGNQKVFDVYFQNQIPIVPHLDIFQSVGFATALDHHIPFQIKDKNVIIGDNIIPIDDEYFTVDFIKTEYDNPKINAIILTNGTIEDVPQLPPFKVTPAVPIKPRTPPPDDDERRSRRPTRTPPVSDPYSADFSNYIIPIAVVLGIFIPVIFFLCRL